MDEIGQKVVASARAFLERLTQADVLNPDQLTEAHMAVTALTYELARNNYAPAVLEQVREQEHALVRDLRGELPGHGTAPRPQRQWQQMWDAGVGAEVTTVLASGAGNAGAMDEATSIDIARKLRGFLVAYHEPMDPVVSAGTRATYQGGRGDKRKEDAAAVKEFSAPAVEAYLRGRFPEKGEIRVLDVKRLMGGYSKETYFVRLDEGEGETTIVIRKDGYGLPTGSSVVKEYAVLKQVYGFGMPVPEPLWVEADTSHFSTAFLAVGFRAGKPANQTVPEEKARREAWATDIAEALALLHKSTSEPEADIRDAIREELADLQRRIEERERAPHPGLAFGMRWLAEHVDDLAGRPAVRVHGDLGFHNMLMRDDKLIALLDWEFSRLGDPVEDISMIRPFMEQMDCWPLFEKVYHEGCGFGADEKAARYFRVWIEVRNLVACLGSLNSLLMPQVKDTALCVAGTIYIPKFEIAVLDAIIEEN